MILDKKQMTEEDVKLQYITPAIQSKWGLDRITMETRITDGQINLKGNFVVRSQPKKADYVLYLSSDKPIAIVEAKDNTHSVSYGLQQAITYARMMDVPFAYSSGRAGADNAFQPSRRSRSFLPDGSERPTTGRASPRTRRKSLPSRITPARIRMARATTSATP